MVIPSARLLLRTDASGNLVSGMYSTMYESHAFGGIMSADVRFGWSEHGEGNCKATVILKDGAALKFSPTELAFERADG